MLRAVLLPPGLRARGCEERRGCVARVIDALLEDWFAETFGASAIASVTRRGLERACPRAKALPPDGEPRQAMSPKVARPPVARQVGGEVYRVEPTDIVTDIVLGVGSGGRVDRGTHAPTGAFVAVKTISVESREKREQMLHEFTGLIRAAGCPYVVQWYAGYVDRFTGFVKAAACRLGLRVGLVQHRGGGKSSLRSRTQRHGQVSWGAPEFFAACRPMTLPETGPEVGWVGSPPGRGVQWGLGSRVPVLLCG